MLSLKLQYPFETFNRNTEEKTKFSKNKFIYNIKSEQYIAEVIPIFINIHTNYTIEQGQLIYCTRDTDYFRHVIDPCSKSQYNEIT